MTSIARSRHAFDAGDLDKSAGLLGSGFVGYHWTARRATLRTWLRRLARLQVLKRTWPSRTLAAFEEL